jgi:hypothetical protein
VTPGSPVALGCEGVILDDNVGWRKCGVGRVSMVNIDNDCIYDSMIDQFKKTLGDKVAQKVGREKTATSKDHAERSKKLRRSAVALLSTAKAYTTPLTSDGKNPLRRRR